MSLLFLAAQGFFLLVHWRRDFRKLMVWGAAHAVLVLPLGLWILVQWRGLVRAANWIPLCSWRCLGARILESGITRRDGGTYLPGLLSLAFGLCILWLVIALVVLKRQPVGTHPRPDRRRAFVLFLFFWWLLPTLALYALSVCWISCYSERYTIHSTQALYLLVGGGVALLPKRLIRVGAAAILAACYAWHAAVVPRPWRPDWCAVAERIDQRRGPNDKIMVYKIYNTRVLRFVWPQMADSIQNAPEYQDIGQAIADAQREGHALWVVVSCSGPSSEFEVYLEQQGIPWRVREQELGWPRNWRVVLYRFGPEREQMPRGQHGALALNEPLKPFRTGPLSNCGPTTVRDVG